jgi:hypothetical protein
MKQRGEGKRAEQSRIKPQRTLEAAENRQVNRPEGVRLHCIGSRES